VSETSLTLADIGTFLAGSGLVFRGFQLDPGRLELYRQIHPGDAWPGSLERWAALEEGNPRLFEGMYLFWCQKKRQ
jgi:hypothetical protein